MQPDRRKLLWGMVAAPMLAKSAFAFGTPFRLSELYHRNGQFSDLALALDGEIIDVLGFMAPPLQEDLRFFVLAKLPMPVCPFCETEAEWPDDILAVYADEVVDVVPYQMGIVTRGRLRLGAFTDPQTGFLSLLRLENSTYRV